ncbi:MAG: type II toxin-antitoxin system RelE/ParE family toxin [Gemmatimonadetes bacterium]|nr:type II toxin-antitoxin system RelE/ParE family toxin [Gemmatimonadota bacterium]
MEYAASARRDLKRLDFGVAARVIQALERLATSNRGDVARLTDVNPPEYRLRVGDWRVRFERNDLTRTITVLRVLPRGDAYR